MSTSLKFFISYNHKDAVVADLIDGMLRSKGCIVKRDIRDVDPWKSFKAFMQKLRDQDYVITIISDAYLKSIPCMDEIGILMEDDYKNKTITVVLKDGLHNIDVQLEYENYWEQRHAELEAEAEGKSDHLRKVIDKDLRRVDKIREDLQRFLDFVGDIHNPRSNIFSALMSKIPEDDQELINDKIHLNEVIQKLNNNILSVQLFECRLETIEKGDCGCEKKRYCLFTFRKIDSITTGQKYDINCIESLYLILPELDYNSFIGTCLAYENAIESGDKDTIDQIRKSISMQERALANELYDTLQTKTPETINKMDCCRARLLVCYKAFALMLDSPNAATLDLFDGELGVPNEIESSLFSSVRTGLLGAVLFGNTHRYYFRYRRGLMKTGRKYCAFVIDEKEGTNVIPKQQLVCLVTIKESNDMAIPADVLVWIDRKEKAIKKAFIQTQGGAMKSD